MRGHLVSLVVGALASLIASYVFVWMTSTSGTPLYLIGALIMGGCVAASVYYARPTLRVPILSEVIGFFPMGQEQYLPQLMKDVRKTKSIFLIGARGLDLVGERSPIGEFIVGSQWRGALEVHLLDADSSFARLRPNSLQADVEKYRAECKAVESFLKTLPSRGEVTLRLVTYRQAPEIRAILLDSIGYVAFYQRNMQGRRLPTYRIRLNRGPMGELIRKYAASLGSSDLSSSSTTAQLALQRPVD